jgi:hypothetical protein
MIARQSQWYRVHKYSYIRDLAGNTWRVQDINNTTVTLINKDRRTVRIDRPAASKAVTLVEPTQEEANKTAIEMLEAVVIEEVPVS